VFNEFDREIGKVIDQLPLAALVWKVIYDLDFEFWEVIDFFNLEIGEVIDHFDFSPELKAIERAVAANAGR